MPDTCGVEIIRRLIEEEDIWLLDEGSCEEETCLLSSGEARYFSCEKCHKCLLLGDIRTFRWLWYKVYSIEDFTDISIDIMCIRARVLPEILCYGELFIVFWHDLLRDSDMLTIRDEDTSLMWF